MKEISQLKYLSSVIRIIFIGSADRYRRPQQNIYFPNLITLISITLIGFDLHIQVKSIRWGKHLNHQYYLFCRYLKFKKYIKIIF